MVLNVFLEVYLMKNIITLAKLNKNKSLSLKRIAYQIIVYNMCYKERQHNYTGVLQKVLL